MFQKVILRICLFFPFIVAFAGCKKTDDQATSTQLSMPVWSDYRIVDSTYEYSQSYVPPYDTITTHYAINATGRLAAQLTEIPRYVIFRTDTFFEVQSGRAGYDFGAIAAHSPGLYKWINLGEDTVRIESILDQGQYYQKTYRLTGIRTR